MNNQLLYRGIARFYDVLEHTYFRNKVRSPRTAVMKFIKDSDQTVLDICTGTGANALEIARCREITQVYGIDRSKNMLLMANEKRSIEKLHNVEFKEMDATNIEFKDGTFDVALLSLVLHETQTELASKIIKEAKRVLKDSGMLIVVEWEQPKSLFQRICFLPIRLCEPQGFHEFLHRDMYEYFEQYGLQVLDKVSCNYSKVLVIKKR